MKHVRLLLTMEALGFGLAALVHAGVVMDGYQHRDAAIAESVIAGVLLLGLTASLIAPRLTRTTGLGVQAFALLGTLVGLFTIAMGVGPQSRFDLALHAGFVTLLVGGLIIVGRGAALARSRA